MWYIHSNYYIDSKWYLHMRCNIVITSNSCLLLLISQHLRKAAPSTVMPISIDSCLLGVPIIVVLEIQTQVFVHRWRWTVKLHVTGFMVAIVTYINICQQITKPRQFWNNRILLIQFKLLRPFVEMKHILNHAKTMLDDLTGSFESFVA